VFDDRSLAQTRWVARELPAHILLDANGEEFYRSPRVGGRLDKAIRKVLAPPAPEETEDKPESGQ
jgi:hypothetical protein